MIEIVNENRETARILAQFLASKAKMFDAAGVFWRLLGWKCNWPSLTVGLLTRAFSLSHWEFLDQKRMTLTSR